ncbi:MAG: hypothetical protein LBH81_03080 [Rickettsiales bacterium]|jgi:hypothetical protein|nr:hypothetical protein [Rickettsiales bacterium]
MKKPKKPDYKNMPLDEFMKIRANSEAEYRALLNAYCNAHSEPVDFKKIKFSAARLSHNKVI